jgi:hypothetical protein
MRVHRLHYDLVTGPDFEIKDAPDITWSTSGFRMVLASNVATFELLAECDSIEDARHVVEPALTAWYAHMTLTLPNRTVSFRYRDADVTMAHDPPSGPHVGETVGFVSSVTAHLVRHIYPDLPTSFTLSGDVQMLVERYRRYLAGGEPLPAIAYACLTYIEALFGGRNEAANQLSVDVAILRKLGQVAAEVGDALSARKFKSIQAPRPITPAEERWMDGAMRALILRLGKLADGGALPAKLDITDLSML